MKVQPEEGSASPSSTCSLSMVFIGTSTYENMLRGERFFFLEGCMGHEAPFDEDNNNSCFSNGRASIVHFRCRFLLTCLLR